MQAIHTASDEFNRLERVARNRSGLWFSIAGVVVGLLIFVAIFNLFIPDFGSTLNGLSLITLGLIFSLVPAALWLIFFYRLDRLEPEPKAMVFDIFLLGALVTAALYGPITQGIFSINTWLYNSWWSHLFGGILVVGFLEEFLVFATVRYAMFGNPEFDERVDGVIYAVAAGIGLATVFNFQYVLAHGGVDLGIGSIRMVINAMAQASFAGVLGYFIGQARFEKVPFYYMPMGLTIAAVFNGIFVFLLDRTFNNGLRSNLWDDLIFATIVAVITLVIVFWLVARDNEETLRLARQARLGGGSLIGGVPAELLVPGGAAAAAKATAMPAAGAQSSSESRSTTPETGVGASEANDTDEKPEGNE